MKRPGAIGSSYKTTLGRSNLASPIQVPGMVLSQPTTPMATSKSCAQTLSSTESAITSREARVARMPSLYMYSKNANYLHWHSMEW